MYFKAFLILNFGSSFPFMVSKVQNIVLEKGTFCLRHLVVRSCLHVNVINTGESVECILWNESLGKTLSQKFSMISTFIGQKLEKNGATTEEASSNRLQCEYCFKSFNSTRNLSSHIQSDHKLKEYECNFCAVRFSKKENCHKHISEAHGELAKQCEICGKGFKSLTGFKNHKKIFHDDASKLSKCHYCGKVFSDISHLARQLMLHTGVKNFVCLVCNKSFVEKRNLTKHKCKPHLKIEHV